MGSQWKMWEEEKEIIDMLKYVKSIYPRLDLDLLDYIESIFSINININTIYVRIIHTYIYQKGIKTNMV